MTITVDWPGTSAIPYQIYVPKADMTLIEAGPPEIYELDIDAFRLILRDLEDDPDGRPWPKTHRHNTEVTLAGVTFARTVEVLPPYSVTFEDGQYAVRFAGANTNVHELTNVNQVSVRPNNSAGLISAGGDIAGVKSDTELIITLTTLVKQALINRLELRDGSVNNWDLYADNDTDVLLTFSVTDVDGNPIALPPGAPARRSRGLPP